MFITALFVITPNWKEPKCPSMNKWINKLCTYNGILLSNKKEWPIETHYNMDKVQNKYTEWKPGGKEDKLFDSMYIKF